jgi:hypothetical protein
MDFAKLLDYANRNYEDYWLDFKTTFNIHSDKDKAELVKDVSAIANTVDTAGYIVYGIDLSGDSPNFRGLLEDEVKEIDESKLQQIVNNRLNRPVRFSFETIQQEVNTYGLLTIPYSDAKPHQVTKDIAVSTNTQNTIIKKENYISEGQVFIRQGSSTRVATAEEIIEMSLNAVNDISKLPEEDLTARVIVLLRRGDYVGIREMLRNAPRAAERLHTELWSTEYQVARNARDLLAELDSRITNIGIAIVRHHSVECYEGLLSSISRILPLATWARNEAPTMDGRRIAEPEKLIPRQNVLVLGGFAASIRNWAFLTTLLRYQMWTDDRNRDRLFLYRLQSRGDRQQYLQFKDICLSIHPFADKFDCSKSQYTMHLYEYDLLAYLYSRSIGKHYVPNWMQFEPLLDEPFIRELLDNSDMRDFLSILPGSFSQADLERWVTEAKKQD